MSISAAQVKELRELTGAGMMDCKAALAETNGDMEAAVDWLRKKGISKADKKAGRTAAEGLIGVDAGLREAVVVEVNSETDFVARNEAFQEIVRNVAKVALAFGGKTETVADGQISRLRQVGHRRHQGRGRHDRREPELPPLGQARASSTARSRPMSTTRSPTISASSACWWRSRRPARPKPRTPSRARSPCMSRPPTRWR